MHEQIDYARAHAVPWGISESAYAGRDHTLAYQRPGTGELAALPCWMLE